MLDAGFEPAKALSHKAFATSSGTLPEKVRGIADATFSQGFFAPQKRPPQPCPLDHFGNPANFRNIVMD